MKLWYAHTAYTLGELMQMLNGIPVASVAHLSCWDGRPGCVGVWLGVEANEGHAATVRRRLELVGMQLVREEP